MQHLFKTAIHRQCSVSTCIAVWIQFRKNSWNNIVTALMFVHINY